MVRSCHIRAHSVLHLTEYFLQVYPCFLEPIDQKYLIQFFYPMFNIIEYGSLKFMGSQGDRLPGFERDVIVQ